MALRKGKKYEYVPLTQLERDTLDKAKLAELDDPDDPSKFIPNDRGWSIPNVFTTPFTPVNTAIPPAPPLPTYIGTRTKKNGTEEITTLLSYYLQRFRKPQGSKPIFIYNNIIPLHSRVSDFPRNFFDEDDDIVIPEVDPLLITMNPLLEEYSLNNNALAMIVSTPVHSIFYILSLDGTLFTIGFGFSGEGKRIKHRNFRINKLKFNFQDIDSMPAVLYTADDLEPKITHESKIVWIDKYTKEIHKELEKLLKTTTEIIYETKEIKTLDERIRLVVTNDSTLKIPYKYFRLAGPLRTESLGLNCIEWAQKIAGVELKCGITRDPMSCEGVTSEELSDVFGDVGKQGAFGTLRIDDVLQRIQNRLLGTSCIGQACTIVRSYVGMGKSRKRGKKRKKRTRRNLL